MEKDPYELFSKSCRIQLEELTTGIQAVEPDSIRRAAELILESRGRLALSGVGKSGQIAQKLAATLSSTGTPSFFIHPVDAMHGDLGALQPGDVMLTLSKSGESDELVEMLRVVNAMETPVISIIAVAESRVGRLSRVVIKAPVAREADPLNLAPTASTTLALVIGDALAMALSELRGFRKEQFARSHPAGQLGKRLLMKVEDFLMTDKGIPVVSVGASMTDLLEEETKPNLGGVMIINEEGLLIGIVTDGDIRRAIMKFGNILETDIRDIMTENPISIRKEIPAIEALKLMEERPSQISVLPVIDEDGKPVGLLRLHDLIRAGL